MVRRLLFQVHMWIGLVLGVLFVALGLSGSILVYDKAIDSLTAPAPRASARGPMLPLDTLIAAGRAASAHPDGAVFLVLPDEAGDPAAVRFPPSGETIFVDPATARILDVRSTSLSPIVQFALDLHGSLFLGGAGRLSVGWLGIAMTLLGLTGLVLWWPRARQWRYAFVVRPAAQGLRLHRELHGAAGIWGFIVFIVVSFTGAGMVFSDAIRNATGSSPVAYSQGAGPAIASAPRALVGADAAVIAARKALPHYRVRSIMIPPGRAISVAMSPETDAPILTLAFVDPDRGEVVGVRDPGRLSGTETFLAWLKPLHTGYGTGPVWQVLVFVSGFLPLIFVTTGVTMWLMKRRNRMAMSRPLPDSAAS